MTPTASSSVTVQPGPLMMTWSVGAAGVMASKTNTEKMLSASSARKAAASDGFVCGDESEHLSGLEADVNVDTNGTADGIFISLYLSHSGSAGRKSGTHIAATWR